MRRLYLECCTALTVRNFFGILERWCRKHGIALEGHLSGEDEFRNHAGAFGNALLDRGAEQVNLKSFRYYDRMLPAQEEVPEGGLGNLIALPLQGRALREGNSAFVDENWNAYPDQWKVLWSKPRLSEEFLQLKLKEWAAERP